MPIDVTCSGCEAKFQVKDEFAGRKVRCSECQSIIDLPAAKEPLAAFPDALGLDSAFQRDKFLLHQKHLSINTRYPVFDEAGKEIMHVVRPTHLLRQIFAVFSVLFVVIFFLIAFIVGLMQLQPIVGDVATAILTVIASAILIVGLVYIWVLLAPKRHITFYRDQTEGQKLLEVLQNQKLAIRMMTYTVRDAAGQEIGRFRKDYLANILRKKWDGFDAQGEHLYVIREDSIILSLLRRLLGSFYGLLRTNFVIHQVGNGGADGQLLGEFNRKFTLLDRYVLDCSHDRSRTMDRRLAIAIGVLLDTAESR